MKTIYHSSTSRGHANHGWLDTYHSFSFANYYNPDRIQFGMLRVLNDDSIEGGGGFGLHPHDNMEIVTLVTEGELEHKDSIGHTGVIRAGEVQVMSAGTGIFHSEYNFNPDKPVHLFQIWIFPEKKNVIPRYDQATFDPDARLNQWQQVVTPDKKNGLWLNQQSWFSRITLEQSIQVEYSLHNPAYGVYVFVIDGSIEAGGQILEKRDGLGVSDTSVVSLKAGKRSDVLVIEIPMR